MRERMSRFSLLFLMLLTFSSSAVRAQVPQSGALVNNKATATYQSGEQFFTAESNEVQISILPQEALLLTADQSVSLPPGASATLPHRLTNTGNTPANYSVIVANLAGDGYDLTNLRVFRDINGNGLLDPGETEIAPNDRLALAPNEFVDLLIVGTVPTTAPVGQAAQVRITAISLTQGARQFNTDTIQTVPGVSLRVSKAAQKLNAAPGEEIVYSVLTQSVGAIEPTGIPAIVDGQNRALVVLRDVVPANSTLIDFTVPGTAIKLYHRVGDPLHTYLTTAPPLGSVDAVAAGLIIYPPRGEVRLSLRVRANSNATGIISNTAVLYSTEPFTNGRLETPSNPVQVTLPRVPPTISYYTDQTFNNTTTVTGLNRPLFVQGVAASCNQDPTRVEQINITIISRLTGDTITRVATETGANTGIFRILPSVATNAGAPDPADNILSIRKDDSLTARLSDCAGQADAVAIILIDPLGVVFDSRTNLPVPGARVTLIDVNGVSNGGNAGGPARVLDFDGVTVVSATVITGPDGSFQYPQLVPGTYRLLVEPPTGFTAPSQVPPGSLPPGRTIDISGSYGGPFQVTIQTGTITIDFPVDGPPPSGLFLEKIASKRQAEIADWVDYQVRVRNTTGFALTNVTLEDLLPRGFEYQLNSARRDGKPLANPPSKGPRLTFNLGNFAVGAEAIISYRTKIGPGAATGDNINRAQATSGSIFGTIQSNAASATVKIVSGVFTTRGIIFGKVFVDKNHNRVQDKGEEGIPGVRIWLEDGTFAVTDEEGKYSIYGVRATTHTVKVDAQTLPTGVKLEPLTTNHGRRGDSSFADLKNGEMQKVNFADWAATPQVLDQVEKRRVLAKQISEIDGGVRANLNPDGEQITPSDRRALPATGLVGAGGAPGSFPTSTSQNSGYTPSGNPGGSSFNTTLKNPLTANIGAPGMRDSDTGGNLQTTNIVPNIPAGLNEVQVLAKPLDNQIGLPVAPAPATLPDAVPLEDILPTLDNKLGFIDLQDGVTLAQRQINVRVKGSGGANFKLLLNGKEIPDSRVGTRSNLASKQLQAWEYIGVQLETGTNTLEVTQVDDFGNAHGSQKISVTAPGDLGLLRLFLPDKALPADGLTPIKIRVELVDANGVFVTARTPITLESSRGTWLQRDLNEVEPGVQLFIEGGRGELLLVAPAEPGQCLIRVSSGLMASTGEISFVPELRPLTANGVLDAKLNLFRFRPNGARPINTSDLFEDDLRKLSQSDSTRLEGRSAMFLKGSVQGKYLLTMRYDSELESGERLFRDIQPDEYYPVYGDSSVKGFDAQSTSRLYVRVDKNQSYVLYGDFLTSGAETSDSLSRYSRSLNGVQLHGEKQKYATNFFFARDNNRRVVDEVPGRGISGPYRLLTTGAIDGSEKVEIIVRDRNQPSLILRTTAQERFTDYSIDGLTEGILFRRPVPSIDADGNPVFIRITYEVDQGGPNFNVWGLNGQYKLGNKFQVGAAWTKDANPQDPTTLQSLNAVFRLNQKTVLFGEWARTDTNLGKGDAAKLELLHNSERMQARLFVGRSDANFDNPESILSNGRKEISARASYRLSAKTRLNGEAIRTSDQLSGGTLTGGQIALDTAIGNGLRFQTGVRHASSDVAAANTPQIGLGSVDFTTAFARLAAQVPNHPEITGFTRYEHSLSDSKQSFQIGGEYQIANRSRLYVAHEFLDSFGGLYALNESQRQYNTRFGIESDYMRNGSLFGEYRLGNGIDGRSAQAALGLRNLWNVSPGLKLSTNFERTQTLNGPGGTLLDDGTAAGIGIEFLRGQTFRATGRLEGRKASGGDNFLSTAGVAWKPGRNLTMLAREAYTKTNANIATNDRAQGRLQMGLAYRQTDKDRLNALLKYEYRFDDNPSQFGAPAGIPTFAQNLTRRVHILSLDGNYQPASTLQMRLHYAWKNAYEATPDLSSRTSVHLLSARLTKDLNRRMLLSLIGSRLWGGGKQQGLGAELGFLLTSDLMLSAGYNFFGFYDNDLSTDEWTQRGAYLRLRFKFDENSLDGWNGFRKKGVTASDEAFKPVANAGLAPAVARNDNPLSGDRPGSLNQLVNE